MNQKFTLIELLIVVAIIAILAGMLIPALSQARLRAQGAQCTSNLKQLGQGFGNYESDYNDLLPTARQERNATDQLWNSTNGPLTWPLAIAPYINFHTPNYGLSFKYPVKSVFVCPRMLSSQSLGYQDYGINSMLTGLKTRIDGSVESQFGTIWRPLKASSVKSSSRSLLLVDSRYNETPACYAQGWYVVTNPTNQVSYRHARKANALYIDGHVQSDGPGVLHLDQYYNSFLPWNTKNLATAYASPAARGIYIHGYMPY